MHPRSFRTFVLRAAIAAVTFDTAAKADLPLVAGNFQIAQRFLHGDAHVVILGDSEQNGLVGLYPEVWHVDHWSGLTLGPNYGTGFNGDAGGWVGAELGQPFVQSDQFALSNIAPAPGIIPGISPSATQQMTFNGTSTSNSTSILDNRVYETVLSANQGNVFYSGDWADTNSGTLHADALLYANPNAVSGNVEFDMRIDGVPQPLATAQATIQSNQSGWVSIPTSAPQQPWAEDVSVHSSVRLLQGTTPQQGSNLIVAGVHYYTDQIGFQLTGINWGGQSIDYFLDGADQNLDQFLTLTDSNTAYIWLGQNNAGYTGPQFKAKMQDLIAKYKAARPGMQFVLVSTYDTGNSVLADYAEDLYEIAQTDPSVLFLNLYKAAGSFSMLDANYLADHVHPNTDGFTYFSGLTENLLTMADSMAVKLPGDANLDGVVDSKDFDLLASNFGAAGTYLSTGDFNGDGVTNTLDFNALASHYGMTLAEYEAQSSQISGSSIVPEPAIGFALTAMTLLSLASRRRALPT